jgi:hypothetical protein
MCRLNYILVRMIIYNLKRKLILSLLYNLHNNCFEHNKTFSQDHLKHN